MRGKAVAQLRQTLGGISRTDLADMLGVHEFTVARWERGDHDPSPLAVNHLRRLRQQHAAKQREDGTTPEKPVTAARPSGMLPSLGS